MGYPIPSQWDGTGMGWRGVAYRPTKKDMGLRTDQVVNQAYFRLAYYPNRLILLLVSHNIPYLLAWDWDGIWQGDPIPSHIFPVTI